MMAPSTATQAGYGGFRIAGMDLALPMETLREVIPCGVLAKLPCAAPYVIGGVDLRGVMVPVIDLRIALDLAITDISFPNVIIMVYENKLLGLLTETVTGIFAGDEKNTSRISFAAADLPVYSGCIRRNDDGALVNLLSPAALVMLKDVPVTEDPESRRLQNVVSAESAVQNDKARPMLLMRCGSIAFAIDAMAVHTTLSDFTIEHSAIAMGDCLGVIDYDNNKVPVLDLMNLCGLGELNLTAHLQAFLIQLPQGTVALLVSKVIDVVRIHAGEIIAMPAYSVPKPSLFRGALPCAAAQNKPDMTSYYFVLDEAALKTDAHVVSLASVNTTGWSAVNRHSVQKSAAVNGQPEKRRNMITYQLSGETASPFEQIKEILPFTGDIPIFDQGGPMLGMAVVRGCSIPVVCLSRLVTGKPMQKTAATSVLVVEVDNEAMGFAIPALESIEPAQWEPELPQLGGSGRNSLMLAIHSNKLAQIGVNDSIRMLPVLDLEKIARAFRAKRLAPA
ncbi:MAG: chemotaxis protein CheW [Betaproteobacteria bacterium]|nr:chemotaxis protein CheW [Betaproteobacteria bacterium]